MGNKKMVATDAVLNKKIVFEDDDFESYKDFQEYLREHARCYKGICDNKYVSEDIDEFLQELILAKACVLLSTIEDQRGEYFDDSEDSIIKGLENGKIRYFSLDVDHNRFVGYLCDYKFDEGFIEEEVEELEDLTDEEKAKFLKIVTKFFNECDPKKYHYNEELEIVTIKNPRGAKPRKLGNLPEKFIQLIISLVILVSSIIVGVAVLPNVMEQGGWVAGISLIVLGAVIASIVVKPTPAVMFFKLCLLGFKVFRGLDLWQREHMRNFGAAVLIIFPLFFIFAILAFVVTLAIGLVAGLVMVIGAAIVFLIPNQIMGWMDRL